MAVWRRKANEDFPTLRRKFSDARMPHKYSVYMVFFDLYILFEDANPANDVDLLQRIFAYAEWCSKQHAMDLWNAAGVAFYEHLFDRREDWDKVIPFLSPSVICVHMGLWEARPRTFLSEDDLHELRVRLDYDRVCDDKGRVRSDQSA